GRPVCRAQSDAAARLTRNSLPMGRVARALCRSSTARIVSCAASGQHAQRGEDTMSDSTPGSPKERPIRTDQWQPPRGSRAVRADNDARPRPAAGEYGEGASHESTGVGPRRAAAEPQVLNDRPGYPDNYGNVASGVYGAHGYTGEPGHPSAYAADSGVPGAAGMPRPD